MDCKCAYGVSALTLLAVNEVPNGKIQFIELN